MLDVDLMEGDVGSTIELKDVLLVATNGDVSVGTPLVDGAVVEAEIIEHGKGPKLRIFKYKNKTRYRRRMGHRTQYTRLEVKRILQDGKELAGDDEKPKKRASKRTTAKAKEAETATEAQVEATTEAPAEVEVKPKRAAGETSPKSAPAEASIEASADAPTSETETKEKPKQTRRTTSKKTEKAPAAADEPKTPAPKRTAGTKAQESAEEEKSAEDKGAGE